ncbi:MAG: precorrin-6y C5,15-methyltransferase (decarboxylating) subunit CbiE [Brucellaceae bacterium]|nr:precorrin-6y C5,15-methyltransferase (decarboxylating) subunit CbiE [Brucellaceae bacterium]
MSADPMPVTAPATPWLSIVGIGEDGVAGLGENARNMIAGAQTVFGGKRHLELAASLIAGEARAWPSPFEQAVAAVLALRGGSVCVLASGDPMFYGVGATLARHVSASEMQIVPAPSAFSLAAARLGWAQQSATCVSLHGRPLALLRPHLQPGRKLLVLTSDADGPTAIAQMITRLGFGPSRFTVLEALGGARERIAETTAAAFQPREIDPLNLVAIEVDATPDARAMPLAPGLPDDWFEHDGQITKRTVRAATISALAPGHGELLWDIGAGSGSISIEWMLRDPSLRAIAMERDAERAARIGRNAEALGVPGLEIVTGEAPAALAALPEPDAVFIGGGCDAAVLDTALARLKPGGRLVVNAVTLETEALLLAAHQDHGGDLLRLAVAHASPVGSLTGWRPAMPVTQWSWSKP